MSPPGSSSTASTPNAAAVRDLARLFSRQAWSTGSRSASSVRRVIYVSSTVATEDEAGERLDAIVSHVFAPWPESHRSHVESVVQHWRSRRSMASRWALQSVPQLAGA